MHNQVSMLGKLYN